MFAGRATGSLRDWPATGPHRYWQSGPGRTDRRGRLLLRSHGDEEQLGQLLDQILTIARPYLARQRCRWETTPMRSQESLLRLRGAGL